MGRADHITRASPRVLELMKYGFGSAIALAVDLALLILLTELAGIAPLWSAFFGFCAGLITIYLVSISWIFETRTLDNRYLEMAIFAVIGVVGLGLNQVFMLIFMEVAALGYFYAKLLTIGLVFGFNFIARQSLLFRAQRG